ncbi:MAG: hypothetical protein COU09_00225 [Candidatus Harrisonbacteria bacterium CG10_big_fil_rev_8_21_14_0_10_44_23]|uniref:Type II secretion system protein GspG C-terminal domain-containing protein n=1 Tax=Candidatus Harrisonbacteria bacterium CG10_big_fil_rev_8_21_14_0_10_44_23 TaxID=1974585 RepID=A0A2H0UR15_9BACT|nr:MAG: hypothetical protein COU09_00225 [Candidatus Harrisonbacteria bacterium CG10_big_fil_rev_8_21_14_0_10_44_23]
MKKTKGFTLIEVLIVVGIIGLLASVILVGLNASRSKARDARRVTDLRQVQQGLELYYVKEGEYPNANSWSALESDLSSVGVDSLPTDPKRGGDSYQYEAGDDQQEYVLQATLEEDYEEGVGLMKDSFTDPDRKFSLPCGVSGSDSYYCVKF